MYNALVKANMRVSNSAQHMEDLDLMMTNYTRIDSEGYRVLYVDGVLKRYSHYIWFLHTEYWPQRGEVVHHINLIRLDDRFSNLQLMTVSEHIRLHNSGENNPNYGNTGSSNHNWIEGPVCYKTQRNRLYRAKKRIDEGRGTLADRLLVQDDE